MTDYDFPYAHLTLPVGQITTESQREAAAQAWANLVISQGIACDPFPGYEIADPAKVVAIVLTGDWDTTLYVDGGLLRARQIEDDDWTEAPDPHYLAAPSLPETSTPHPGRL